MLRHYEDAEKCRAFIPISRTVSTRIYSLGISPDEQQRLHRQREIYGDTADLKFGATDTVCEIGAGANLTHSVGRTKFQIGSITIDLALAVKPLLLVGTYA